MPYTTPKGRELTFDEYMRVVDHLIGHVVPGMGHRDLVDRDWRDAYDGETDPREAVGEALEDEGFSMEGVSWRR